MNFQDLKTRFAAGTIDKPGFIREALSHHQALFGYTEVTRSTDVREIRITPEGVCFTMADEGIVLWAPPGEARVAPLEVMNFDRYEPAETRVMDLVSDGARCVLDIGANIGWYAVRFAKRLPAAEVHAFEPMPVTQRYLQRNVAANGVGGRVYCHAHGLSDTAGAVDFFLSPAAGTNASLKNVAGAADAQRVTGLTLTLDRWVAQHGVAPDFIKCDVEGAELPVFRGARQVLAEHKPVVFAELLRKWSAPFGYHPNDMLAYFAELGYGCHAVGEHGVRAIAEVTEQTAETNYVFLHRRAHAAMVKRLEAF